MRSDIGACSADESETGTESFTLSQPGIKTWLLGLQSRASTNSPQTSSLHRAVLLPVSGGEVWVVWLALKTYCANGNESLNRTGAPTYKIVCKQVGWGCRGDEIQRGKKKVLTLK